MPVDNPQKCKQVYDSNMKIQTDRKFISTLATTACY